MKKFTILTLVAVILLGMTSCNALSGKPATEKWIAPNNTVSAWFRADWTGDTAPGMLDIYDTTSLHIGKTADGADIFALLRVPLSGTWLAGEIKGARLFLKIREGAVPSELRVGFASEPWSFADTTLAQAERFCDPSGLESVSVRSEADGWISLEVTKFVKAWLNCDMPNYGFSLFSDKPGEELVIEAADWEEENPRFPYLEVSGEAGKRELTYGRFGYTEQPSAGTDATEGGNCMSYALRDTRMILADDLELDYDSMNSLYAVGGEGAVLEYIAGLVEDYVEAHRGSLKILDFRRLESFDSAIDPKKEYRIALRIGCKIWDGEEIDLGGKGNFDYHFRAQLSDGQWAQKFPADISEVIPCSGPGLSPGKYPWNSALQWMPKFQNYYTGDVVYYAVTKDTDDFTRHKSAEETQ